jgi:signal transduction histidine kinase
MKTYSLHRRALISLIAPLSFAILVAAGAALWYSYRTISNIHDANMVQHARFLLLLAKHEAIEGENIDMAISADLAQPLHFLEKKIGYKIWNNHTLITKSTNADSITEPLPTTGFTIRKMAHEDWVIYTLHEPSTHTIIEIAEERCIRTELLEHILKSLIIPLLLSIPVLLYLFILGINKAINPVTQLCSELDQRHAHDLYPLTPQAIPSEIIPLFTALNRLFSRLNHSIAKEREFTDNAAHELRTPLAALKTRTQILTKRAKPYPELHESLDELHAIVERATSVVDQLLSFTRLQEQLVDFEAIAFSELLAQSISEFSYTAHSKVISLRAEITPQLTIMGHAGSLHMMLRNLLDNAIRYSPEHSDVIITLTQDPAQHTVLLTIADTGAGIPEGQRERMFERFTRIDTSKTGSGLGLAIVKWVCDTHHATITLDDNTPHGLVVRIIFEV